MTRSESQNHSRLMTQSLAWGSVRQERAVPADTMFTVTGRRLYVIGDIDGQFRPRSNPYDLYAFGKPDPNDPLANKLQGVWAQPVKGFDGYGYAVETPGGRWELRDAVRFTQRYASVEFVYESGLPDAPLRATRRDFAAPDLPVLFSVFTLVNTGSHSLDLSVIFTAQFDLQDAWFTQLGERRNAGQAVSVEAGCLVARSELLPERWAAVAGCLSPAEAVVEDSGGALTVRLFLAAGAQASLTFGMVVESEEGASAALELLVRSLPRAEALLEEKLVMYEQLYQNGPHLISPDPFMNESFDVARANLRVLEAEQPAMGPYFYAGLEMFPFWFSNDGAYSVPGLMASGLRTQALNHLRIGLAHLDKGRIPHQISPSGKVAFAGNAQETPQWVMSIWDAFRWTGDRKFLAALYPGAWEGMFAYVLGAIDPDGDGYPSGPGMVEVEGMGAEKLDSAAFTWAALHTLAKMADSLGEEADARQARERAAQIANRFDADWWDEPGGTYAMSLEEPGNARLPVPHWAVIVPLEVGLASIEHAARTIATLRAQYLNRWGLKHTAGSDERVWTLPTATLSRAAYRYGAPELGYTMLRHIAETLGHGSIGLFHELIPQGACVVQLWSGATFLRGVIEDLLGIEIRADLHQISLTPQLPAEWGEAHLENLSFGEHAISLHFSPAGVRVDHHCGPEPLLVRKGEQEQLVEPGASGLLAA